MKAFFYTLSIILVGGFEVKYFSSLDHSVLQIRGCLFKL